MYSTACQLKHLSPAPVTSCHPRAGLCPTPLSCGILATLFWSLIQHPSHVPPCCPLPLPQVWMGCWGLAILLVLVLLGAVVLNWPGGLVTAGLLLMVLLVASQVRRRWAVGGGSTAQRKRDRRQYCGTMDWSPRGCYSLPCSWPAMWGCGLGMTGWLRRGS